MRRSDLDGSNAAKKPKVVGPRDSYPTPSTTTHVPPSSTVVSPVTTPAVASPAHRSPAARLHASRSSDAARPVPDAPIRPAPGKTGAIGAHAGTTPTSPPPPPCKTPPPSKLFRAAGAPSLVPVPCHRSVHESLPHLPSGRLMPILRAIIADTGPTTQPSEFRFDWTPTAAAHNASVLRRFHTTSVMPFAPNHSPPSHPVPSSAPHVLAPLLSRPPFGLDSSNSSLLVLSTLWRQFLRLIASWMSPPPWRVAITNRPGATNPDPLRC
jgi:hypothetical protein